jgi:hypothetical protein
VKKKRSHHAVQEPEPKGVDVDQPSGDGGAVGEGNGEGEKAPEESLPFVAPEEEVTPGPWRPHPLRKKP